MGSMDSSAAKLLRHPPPPQAAGELPAAPPAGEGGGRVLAKLSGKQLRALAAILLVLDYVDVVLKSFGEAYDDAPGDPLAWRRPAAMAIAYAAAAALIWFLRRQDLEWRWQLDDHDAHRRCDLKTKVVALILVCAIAFMLGVCSGSMTPCALNVFAWVGSRDHVYLGLEVHEEEGEEQQYEV